MNGLSTSRACHDTPFRPIGNLAAAFLDRIDRNAYRQMAGHELIDAVLKCGPDAVRFLGIILAALSPGHPVPTPYGLMREAQEWAEWADQRERDAYLIAIFTASSPDRRAAFLSHVGARAAA